MGRRFTYYSSALDFAPDDLSGLVLWVDATDATTINTGTPIDGDQVNLWTNKGTGTTDAAQATSTRQPIYRASGYGSNSTAYIDFDGSNDFLDLGTEYSKPSEYTTYAVFEHDTNSSVCIIGDLRSNGLANTASMHIRVEGGIFRNQFGNPPAVSFINSTEALSFSTPYTVESKYTTGNQVTEMWSNGSELTENLIGASPASSIGGTKYKMSIGRLGDFNGRYLNGALVEIINYDRPLNATEQGQVRTYLQNKYGTF